MTTIMSLVGDDQIPRHEPESLPKSLLDPPWESVWWNPIAAKAVP